MLATFYAKAIDADLPNSILHDRWARQIVDRIDYDWTRTTMTAGRSPAVTTRSAHFDDWTRQFLAVHPEAVVLHLGCGLDSRFFRVSPGPGVWWYDIDYPEVVALRERLYSSEPGASAATGERPGASAATGERPGASAATGEIPGASAARYRVIPASVTDPAWLADIPTDRPVLMLGEGLTMYLTEADGTALLRRIVARFPSGELQFDAFSRFGIKAQWTNAVVRNAGATLYWGIDRPQEIIAAVPGVRLLAWQSPFETASFRQVSLPLRLMARVMSALPATKYMAQYHRYAF
ncbi:class I SAM-dependent methyltransferase [Mycolicibacterium sp. 120266]|uniref:class I SAM-dependent methyltransferase n=1 Tax=Mycolicibacterium sp. 120266 TaxID=3090601 RepID=UPI00299E4CE3|nr:class I SAM-dependent methyltransferase [Mycolicibacterium sp. 120266]MDX1871519.1 class I SAM-dependent methyltransferase [Mycolicibacterium sp. 120266]